MNLSKDSKKLSKGVSKMHANERVYIDIAEFLRKNEELLGVQSEVSQIYGAISCKNNNKTSIAICGKTDSYYDYLLRLITDDNFNWNDILYSLPFKLEYGQAFSIKCLIDGQVESVQDLNAIPKEKCEFVEITTNIPFLKNYELLFVPLLEGNEKNIFDKYISACDCIVLCPNLSNAIGIEYHKLCELISNEWQQPERVCAIAYDINNLSLPGTMLRALSSNLGLEKTIPYMVIDSFKSFSYNQEELMSLLKFKNDKNNVLARTHSYIDSACKKIEKCMQEHISQKEKLEKDMDIFSDKVKAFKAQAVINIPSLGMILDENMKSNIFEETANHVRFIQGKISEELQGVSKEEMDAYVPVYYSHLISEFIKEISNSTIIPTAQKKFDDIIDEILNSYKQAFGMEIPYDLLEKTKIAKENFFSFVDRTAVDKADIGMGIVETTILAVIVYDNPFLCFFAEEIMMLTYELKRGLFNIYNKFLRSTESYAKEISNRVNAVLDENLQNIPKQIEDVFFPTLERNMNKALENFISEAVLPMEQHLIVKKEKISNIQKNISDIKNIQNNLDGLINKCN